ncbi:MAG: hypothetical protein JJ855_04485 [Rhodospirillales bacterium]|nr:hypothetical protein [Rhodospirillales bacterium]
MLRKFGIALIFAVSLSACSYVDEYERQVHDWEPTYCYKSLGAVQCYRAPKHSDSLRLVNYYGPHPSRYDAPEPLQEPNFKAPEMVNYWVKDPEPIPRPMAKGDLTDRPWLTAEGKAEASDIRRIRTLETSATGTRAFLRRIATGETPGTSPTETATPAKFILPDPAQDLE